VVILGTTMLNKLSSA